MFLRAVLAFLALPGLVAFAVPAWFVRDGGRALSGIRLAGLVPFALGLFLLLWCVRNFYVLGKGTLAPWDPPRHLVIQGPYRVSRNPMYVAVSLILLGWAIGAGLTSLWIYAIAVPIAFHLRVVLNEEPFLERTQGDAWLRYKASVPRWIGRRR